jgi:hypothetical protein
MKLFRFALSIWITVASLFSFLLGWVALAHAPKPVQSAQTTSRVALSAPALPTLTPLQSLQSGDNGGNSFPSFQPQKQPSQSFYSAPAPIFQSGGS